MSQNDFLSRLKSEAALQARLQDQRFLPAQMDVITSFIGRHSWQVIVFLAFTTSLVVQYLKWMG